MDWQLLIRLIGTAVCKDPRCCFIFIATLSVLQILTFGKLYSKISIDDYVKILSSIVIDLDKGFIWSKCLKDSDKKIKKL